MKAKLGNIEVDVWPISLDEPQDEWVRQAFQKLHIAWSDDMGIAVVPLVTWPFMVDVYGKIQKEALVDRKKRSLRPLLKGEHVWLTVYSGGPVVTQHGGVGDYLIYSPQLDNRYELYDAKKAKKNLTFIS